MKKILLSLAALCCAITGFGQGNNTREGGHHEQIKSLWELATKQEKKNDAFNVYLNYAGSFQEGLNPSSSVFQAKQFRVEVKGSFGDHLTYRFRHRLNRTRWSGAQEDNFAKATDIMMLGWKFNDKWQVSLGKMCQIWGGFEFDENPMYIYQYSDFIDYMDNFMTGAMVSWHPVPAHEIAVMVSNSFTTQPAYHGIERSAHPLTYILNWNGSMFDGMLNTRWSVGTQTMAKNKYSTMLVLGQQLALPKFQVYLDYMAEFDQIDRLGIVTEDLRINSDVQYHSLIAKANWQFAPKWNFMGKGMYELASVNHEDQLKNYRRSIGWVGSLEYYPWEEQDLRFFVAYIGRHHHFNQVSGLANGTTNRIEIGFMYRIKAY